MRGLLIVIEGPDGSGKRTQSELLDKHLAKSGFRVKRYSYPDYGSPYGKLIAEHLQGTKMRGIKELFLLYLADMVAKAEDVEREIRSGSMVIMDRYFQSTVAYQSSQGFNYEDAKSVENIFGLTTPDLGIYVDIPATDAMRRKQRQRDLEGEEADVHEKDARLQENVRAVYERMIREGFGAKKWVVVDGRVGIDKTQRAIAGIVDGACVAAGIKK